MEIEMLDKAKIPNMRLWHIFLLQICEGRSKFLIKLNGIRIRTLTYGSTGVFTCLFFSFFVAFVFAYGTLALYVTRNFT